MNINNLVIEVTRKCNMSCFHCLRGEAINVNMKKEYIDTLIEQIGFSGYINSVVFTGGEPTLNVPIMEYFLYKCKLHRIGVGFFYLATNGLKVKEDFVMFCLRMYAYCDEKDTCGINISNDQPHQCEGDFNDELLKGLSFFTKKFTKDNWNYNNGESYIKQGRSTEGHEPRGVDIIEDSNDWEDAQIYLNCKGEIICGCDWSYINQSKHKICDVGDLRVIYEGLYQHEEV